MLIVSGASAARIRKHFGKQRKDIRLAQGKQMHPACGGHLHQAGQMTFALMQCRPHLGIEANDALLAWISTPLN